MPLTIYKYKLTGTETTVELPVSSVPRYVGEQDGDLYVWVELYSNLTKKTVAFNVYGTGWPIDTNGKYLGTVQMKNNLVFHVYYK